MGEDQLFPAAATGRRSKRAVARFLLGAAAVFSLAGTVAAARFGAPPGPTGPDPPGYLMLVSSDAGDPIVSDGWGERAT